MADHSNIQEPTYAVRNQWAALVEVEKLKLALTWAEKERDHYRDNLESIFTRAARGDHVDLYYGDGSHIRLTPPATPSDKEGEE